MRRRGVGTDGYFRYRNIVGAHPENEPGGDAETRDQHPFNIPVFEKRNIVCFPNYWLIVFSYVDLISHREYSKIYNTISCVPVSVKYSLFC